MNYRLGFDLGFTSIGWSVILLSDELKPLKIEDFGVRIFPSGREPKTNEPKSVERRRNRNSRRNHDRYIMRRKTLLKFMIEKGLQPATKAERTKLAKTNPYDIRNKAVDSKISLFDLGRALFHINQRRGFKSNLIADKSTDDKEKKGLKKGIDDLESVLKNTGITLGQYLFLRLQKGQSTRMKAHNSEYEIYTNRAMYMDEVNQILEQQKKHYPNELRDEIIDRIKEIIFFQRPLKVAEPGYCTLLDGMKRSRLAYPESQQFRIYQEVNNLNFVKETEDIPDISPAQRKEILKYLLDDFSLLTKTDKMLSWAKIKKILNLSGNIRFNLQELGRKGLKADVTSYWLKPILKDKWTNISAQQKRGLIDILILSQNAQDVKDKVNKFCNEVGIKVSDDEINQLIGAIGSLESGYASVSVEAMEKINPNMAMGHIYSEACQLAGINHSEFHTGEVFPFGNLPYYGQTMPKLVIGGEYDDKSNPEVYYGKINNPTVHMALNQFRLIINELVKKYGEPPKQIHIELARETAMSAKQLKEHNQEQTKNQKENEKINDILNSLGMRSNYDNRMKYKLWEDLAKEPDQRCCPLSGKTISIENLYSSAVEVEHIIPFSLSFDDSRNNKMLCYSHANKFKKNRTPFDAFNNSPGDYNWSEIIARAKNMPRKYWRFLPDALDKFKTSKEGQYIQRQLNDTRYMSKLARQYAEFVSGPYTVRSIKGKFTSDLRHHWGLEQFTHDIVDGKFTKNRNQHHHHAIDAIVVGLTDNNTMKKVAKANKRAVEKGSHKAILKLEPPFDGFDLNRIELKLKNMVISHKIDHKGLGEAKSKGGTIGALHEDTNYGLVGDKVYAVRKELNSVNFDKPKSINKIANDRIRADITKLYESCNGDKKQYDNEIENYKLNSHSNPYHRLKKVRVHETKSKTIPIKDKNNKAYRYVIGGNNFCAEIWCPTKGKKQGMWQVEVIQNYHANQKGFMPNWRKNNPTAYKVMRLQINDMVAIEKEGTRVICRVQKMDSNGRVVLRNHNDATTESKSQISTSGTSLQKYNARKLFVSPAGKVYDPGHAKIKK